MKMGKIKVNPRKLDHHVILPRQDVDYSLRDLHRVTGGGKFLFPNRCYHKQPASHGAILQVMRRMDYGSRHIGHGFRSLVMGIKARLGYRDEVVKRQLAHGSDDEYGEAYAREQLIEKCKAMMPAYADYILASFSRSAMLFQHRDRNCAALQLILILHLAGEQHQRPMADDPRPTAMQ